MNFLSFLTSILGTLPASDSIKGKLNSLDWKKTIRSTLLPGVLAYIAVATLEKLLTDISGIGLPEGITTQAVLLVAPLLELLRRKYAGTISYK